MLHHERDLARVGSVRLVVGGVRVRVRGVVQEDQRLRGIEVGRRGHR